MNKYADIIERLEKATGPNFDLECKIKAATGDEFLRVPTYTASIDAAIALVERMLPGCYPGFQSMPPWSKTGHDRTLWSAYIITADMTEHEAEKGMLSGDMMEVSTSAPLALLLALFRALEAKEGG